MRRFFLGGRNKDKDKDKQDSSNGDSKTSRPSTASNAPRPSDAGSAAPPALPLSSADLAACTEQNKTAETGHEQGQQQQQHLHPANGGVGAAHKQVAFASPAATRVHSRQATDVSTAHSTASYHGGSSTTAAGQGHTGLGLACFPSPSTLQSGSNTRSLSSPNTLAPPSPLALTPSLPVRHVSLQQAQRPTTTGERDRDATLRAHSGSSSPLHQATRGEIPRFAGHDVVPPLTPQQQRSTTSMSHNTTASTSGSSLADARHAFYGANTPLGNGSADSYYYPNLAVLATYSRDMNAFNAASGIVNSANNKSIMQHLTWSEITDEQLVQNLGGRERTRQEVLFEMVCSEERYVQELLTLKEHYLQPLLERHTLAGSKNAAAQPPNSAVSASTLRSTHSGISSRLEAEPYVSATMKSTESFEVPRPYLSLSAGSTSSHGHGHASRSMHNTSAGQFGQISSNERGYGHHHSTAARESTDRLPIAARFARRASVDSAPTAGAGSIHVGAASSDSTDTTAHTSYHGRRDISAASGGTGTTAVDSGDDTDATSSQNHHGDANAHIGKAQRDNGTGNKQKTSRLHPLFANFQSTRSNTGLQDQNVKPAPSTLHASTTSVNVPRMFRHHLKNLVPPPPNKLHKTSTPNLKDAVLGPAWVVKDLPEDLGLVCDVVMRQILEGHEALSGRLRARYEEQFPLVRTLADVFHDQAWMIEHYATYVLHIERALQDIDETLSLMNPLVASSRKVKSKDKEAAKEQKRLAKIIMRLEEEAAMKAAPGLSICLSQPFQRLLKYPLLFQSLLYHTDPSTRDYDATQKLALEIDAIVRSIENEKASEEDRARTRDVWARIDGVNDRALLMPRAERVLMSEAAMWQPAPTVAAARRTFSDAARRVEDVQAEIAAANKKKTTRRLSDIAGLGGHKAEEKKKKQPSVGSKRDVWLVTFSDVVIRCQRVGVTNLPVQSSLHTKNQLNGLDNRRTVMLTNRERNLYRFLKVDHWVMDDKTTSGRAGIVSMDAVVRSRRTSERIEEDVLSESELEMEDSGIYRTPEIQRVKFERDEQSPGIGDEAQSRMSFTYTGDEARPAFIFDVDPLVGLHPESQPASSPQISPPRKAAAANKAAARTSISTSTQQAIRKEGIAAAKFSNRVRPSLGETTNLQVPGKRPVSPSAGRNKQTSARTGNGTGERVTFNKPTAASLARSQTPAPSASAAGSQAWQSRERSNRVEAYQISKQSHKCWSCKSRTSPFPSCFPASAEYT